MAIKFDDVIASNTQEGVLTTSDQIKISTTSNNDKLLVGSDITTNFSIDDTFFNSIEQQVNHSNFKSITLLSEYPKAVDTAINEVIRVTTNLIAKLANKISNSSDDSNTGLDAIKTDKYLITSTDINKANLTTIVDSLTVGAYGYIANDITLSTDSNANALSYNLNMSTKPFNDITKIPKNTLIKVISTDTSNASSAGNYDLANNITIIAMPGGSTDDALAARVTALETLLKLDTD